MELTLKDGTRVHSVLAFDRGRNNIAVILLSSDGNEWIETLSLNEIRGVDAAGVFATREQVECELTRRAVRVLRGKAVGV